MSTANAEPEVTVESLGKSLEDLMKAADATALVKGGGGDGNRVEHSGTQGSDGKQGGGRGSMSDAGSLDDMMIGKLADAGFSADQIATMTGALKGKAAEAEEEEDDDDDEEMEGYLSAAKASMKAYAKKNGSMKGFPGVPFGKSGKATEGEPLVKSIDQFRKDPDIDAAIDVSPYLEAMTARTAEQIDAMNVNLSKGFGSQATVNRALAGALHQMGTLLKSQSMVVEALRERLGIVERQPNAPKGKTTASALSKSMPGEAGRGGEQLSKAEVLATLSYMNLEKGIRHINGQATSQAIGLLEGGGMVAPAVLKAVDDFHAAHPQESQVARQYH